MTVTFPREACLLLGNAASPTNLASWIATAVVIGGVLLAAYAFVLRHDIRVVPFAAAILTTAGTLGDALVLNTPGSTTGAVECLDAVLDVVPHALALLAGERPH